MEAELSGKKSLIDKMKEEMNSLKEEVGKRKESEKNLSDSNDKLRNEILNLKDEVERHKDRTATDEVVMLRNELRFAMEAEENSKQAMDELAMVLREVAAESNTAKERLASAEKQVDRLRAEAEESVLAWDEKEMELVKCLKQEQDEKAKLKEENRKVMEWFTDLEQKSKKLIEDTEKLREALKECFEETEMAKAQCAELKDCLVENGKRLNSFMLENERLRAANDNAEEKRSHGGTDEEAKKLAHSSSKKESRPQDEKALVVYSKKGWIIPFNKEAKSTVGVEEKELKKIKRDPSVEKDLKSGIPRTKSSGLMCFAPMAMLPIAGISKHKEAGSWNDDSLTDSIFDIVEPSQAEPQHRRTASSLEDEKAMGSDEVEHEKKPHLDDMEIERAGSHNTKKSALLKKFGDLWRRKNQGQSQRHHTNQIHSLNHKEVTT